MDKGFVEKVATMRRLQRDYFRHRDHITLAACKKAEREVDALVASYDTAEKNEQKYLKLF